MAKEIDFVLITHSDMLHLGGLPYAVATLGLSCPIYVTSCGRSLAHTDTDTHTRSLVVITQTRIYALYTVSLSFAPLC